MSWDSTDAMSEVVRNCLNGWGCEGVAIRWLEKEEQFPGCSRKRSDEIKETIKKLRNDLDQEKGE